MARYMVTSALPYANGPLHLGHLAGAYLPADIFVRYARVRGHDVLFCSGTDEHGVPITITAEKMGLTPMEVVDRFHKVIEDDFRRFGVRFDNFSRTSRPEHVEFAQGVFLQLLELGHIVPRDMKQLYCPSCERYLPDRYINGTCPKCGSTDARGDQCESCGTWTEPFELKDPRCGICGSVPEARETRHWFLLLDHFQEWLEGWLEEREGWKSNVLKYCRSWLGDGLRERAITRDISWGVPVPLPEAEGKVLYVWFEALLGYISSTRECLRSRGEAEDSWKTYWQDPETRLVQFIGKDNVVFHCIIEPAILHGLGEYVLPWNVPANEFLNISGEKFSTSRGTGINMGDYLEHFPPDPMRYALAVNAPETRDTDFSWTEYQSRNNELADVLGNFVNRTVRFTIGKFQGIVPDAAVDPEVMKLIHTYREEIAGHMENFRFKKAASAAMDLAREGNRYFDTAQPWKTRKTDPEACAVTVATCLNFTAALAVVFEPIIPFSTEKIRQMLNIGELKWDDAGRTILAPGHELGKPEILFTKLEDGFHEVLSPRPAEETPAEEDFVEFDDFMKIRFRVGRIIEVDHIKKADKLYRLTVDTGDRHRTVVAGMKKHYTPEELLNRLVAVVCNLKPVKLCGVQSEGMLMASDGGNGVFLLEPGQKAEPGDVIR
ncbi:MAG TPA: methionine--tRNA ligase [Candidatus Sabulitectum sp.]|nr:methionine--tRNA ligase [Candidatus Sabulitectum sp.]HPJ27612.1 methionine--tRNA ligase [Candidatus Sabulitectum sp.]HPR21412.1 methionine--tRNA ligase [Candidatus Sabulitectum sp.]HRW77228.1 methionine--tRNA ligase [Candidatus Sabulitectum sp.]